MYHQSNTILINMRAMINYNMEDTPFFWERRRIKNKKIEHMGVDKRDKRIISEKFSRKWEYQRKNYTLKINWGGGKIGQHVPHACSSPPSDSATTWAFPHETWRTFCHDSTEQEKDDNKIESHRKQNTRLEKDTVHWLIYRWIYNYIKEE